MGLVVITTLIVLNPNTPWPACYNHPWLSRQNQAILIYQARSHFITRKTLLKGKAMQDQDLGQVADKVLFENERVRIWELNLQPGESSDFHEHKLDYLLCVIAGESIDADFVDGTNIQIPVEPGTTLFVPKGNSEVAINRSDVPYREILIELK